MQKVKVLEQKYNTEGRCYALVERLLDDNSTNGWVVCAGFVSKESSKICHGGWDQGYYFLNSYVEAKSFFDEVTKARDYIFNSRVGNISSQDKKKGIKR